MSDLTGFLAARFDEDAAVAEGGDQRSPDMTYRLDERLEWVSVTPARVLAEVEAKRRIVAIHVPVTQYGQEYCQGCGVGHDGEYYMPVDECPERRALAAVYAGHPDHRPEWAV